MISNQEEKAVAEIKSALSSLLSSHQWRAIQVFARAKLYVLNAAPSSSLEQILEVDPLFQDEFAEIV